MPEPASLRRSDDDEAFGAGTPDPARPDPAIAGAGRARHDAGGDPVSERVRGARAGLTALLAEADVARLARAEAAGDGGSAVCAWNHFENIPTFYNWNNRPR